MARYIDAEQFRGKHEVAEINGKLYSVIPYADIVYAPTADVVPKSEVEIWKQNRFNLYQKLECYKMARQKVAREIFAEIEENIVKLGSTNLYGGIKWDVLAELKKKYTEGKKNEN